MSGPTTPSPWSFIDEPGYQPRLGFLPHEVIQPILAWLGELFFCTCVLAATFLGSLFAPMWTFPIIMIGSELPEGPGRTAALALAACLAFATWLGLWWLVLPKLRIDASRSVAFKADEVVIGRLLGVCKRYNEIEQIHFRLQSPRVKPTPEGVLPEAPNVTLSGKNWRKLLFLPREDAIELVKFLRSQCPRATSSFPDGSVHPPATGWDSELVDREADKHRRKGRLFAFGTLATLPIPVFLLLDGGTGLSSLGHAVEGAIPAVILCFLAKRSFARARRVRKAGRIAGLPGSAD